MSLGPEKIILILVVALIVFGPQRLPEIARQVGAMMRELRRMQDTVRDELEHVLHPDFTPPSPTANAENASIGETDHAALPPGRLPADTAADYSSEDVTDDGFSGPRSFS
jgi:Tat protein translocase TatB subunit